MKPLFLINFHQLLNLMKYVFYQVADIKDVVTILQVEEKRCAKHEKWQFYRY